MGTVRDLVAFHSTPRELIAFFIQPRVAFLTTFLVIAFASIRVIFGIILGSGFEEASLATLYSVCLLMLTAWICFQIAGERQSRAGASNAHFWRFVGVAFAFLAMDEGLQIHERLDHLIHLVFGITETAWSDRIDDLIVIGYGIAGVAILFRFRTEISETPGSIRYLAIAFCLFLVSSVIDVLTNRNEFLDWFQLQGQLRFTVEVLAEIVEEGGKLLAVTALLLAFSAAWTQRRTARQEGIESG